MRAIAMMRRPDGVREKKLVTDWPEPPGPAGNQVKVQAMFTGVTNGTERNGLLRGNYAPKDEHLPSTYGYQHVGRVVEVGPDARNLRVGDVIFSSSHHEEYAVVREDGLLTRLPDGVAPRHAALWGVASVSFHDARRADVKPEDNVLVVGAGLIGQFAAQAARVCGARVTVADVDDARLDLARRLGADATVNVASPEGLEQLRAAKKAGRPFTVVFEDSGADVLDWIIGGTWVGGVIAHRARVLMIAGRFDVKYNFNAAQDAEVAVLHAGHFTRGDLEQVARLTARGDIRIEPLIRDVVAVAEAGGIYDTLRDRPNELLGTVFDWSEPGAAR